jgi:hypothetical protein
VLCATATTVLAERGAVVAPGRPAPDSLIDALAFFAWHFLNLVPFLEVPRTARLESPPAFEGWPAGAVLVAFEVMVIGTLLPLAVGILRYAARPDSHGFLAWLRVRSDPYGVTAQDRALAANFLTTVRPLWIPTYVRDDPTELTEYARRYVDPGARRDELRSSLDFIAAGFDAPALRDRLRYVADWFLLRAEIVSESPTFGLAGRFLARVTVTALSIAAFATGGLWLEILAVLLLAPFASGALPHLSSMTFLYYLFARPELSVRGVARARLLADRATSFAVVTLFFVALNVVLVRIGLAHVPNTASSALSLKDSLETYLNETARAVPAIDIPAAFEWEPARPFTDHVSGILLLSYKVLVIVPAVALAVGVAQQAWDVAQARLAS